MEIILFQLDYSACRTISSVLVLLWGSKVLDRAAWQAWLHAHLTPFALFYAFAVTKRVSGKELISKELALDLFLSENTADMPHKEPLLTLMKAY